MWCNTVKNMLLSFVYCSHFKFAYNYNILSLSATNNVPCTSVIHINVYVNWQIIVFHFNCILEKLGYFRNVWMQLGCALSNMNKSTQFSSKISSEKFPTLPHFIFPAAPLPVLVLPFISHNIRSAWEERHHINHHWFYLRPHWQFLKHTQTKDLTHHWDLRELKKRDIV